MPLQTKTWSFARPHFEFNSLFKDEHLPWAGHKLFAYDLVCNMKPQCIVELGTYKGTSLFSFAQALKDTKNFDCRLVGIDTWQGDINTGKYEGDAILSELEKIQQTYYKDVNITLVRELFDEVASRFSIAEINILHIDGLHTYEAVSHDYTMWKDKVKPGGIILFHDTLVDKKNYGVKQFWHEHKSDFAFSLNFPHSWGLGIGFTRQPDFDFNKSDEFYCHYIEKAYEACKYSLFKATYSERELLEIKNSKMWRLKEFLKRIIGKK